ncbi:hypothetical protein ACFYM2_07140 [Streptomyces sp. NPDC006711]|uniref:hypothetical protein n=1 Tax=unclassified Streptomyces TaxID=2593676 RepID=UPI0033D4383F
MSGPRTARTASTASTANTAAALAAPARTPGGGPVLTGPASVTGKGAPMLEKRAARGTR